MCRWGANLHSDVTNELALAILDDYMKRRSPSFDPETAAVLIRRRQQTLAFIGALAAHWVEELNRRPSKSGVLHIASDSWPHNVFSRGIVFRNIDLAQERAPIKELPHLIVGGAGVESDTWLMRVGLNRRAGWGKPTVRLPRPPGYERRARLTLYPSHVREGLVQLSRDVAVGTRGAVLWRGDTSYTTPQAEDYHSATQIYTSKAEMRRSYAWHCTNALGLTALVAEGLRAGCGIESDIMSLSAELRVWRPDLPETAHRDYIPPLWIQVDVPGLKQLLAS